MSFDRMMTICENCPGTQWGRKSICRVHSKSIGEIDSCLEWEKSNLVDVQQRQPVNLEPAMELFQKTEDDLKGYHWMNKEIDRLEGFVNKEIRNLAGRERLVAAYGIEAALPKGQGKPKEELTIVEERFARQCQRLEKLKEKVKSINEAAESIDDEKERTVLECMLDGERMNLIARHVGVSRQRLNEIKRGLVNKMAVQLYEKELQELHLLSS